MSAEIIALPARKAPADRPEEPLDIDFEPIAADLAEAMRRNFIDDWHAECRDLGVMLRVARLMLMKTKPELIEAARVLWRTPNDGAGPEQSMMIDLLEKFRLYQELLEEWTRALKEAKIRSFVAAECASDYETAGSS